MNRTIFESPWLNVVVKDDWYYFAQIPGSKGGVSILLYRTEKYPYQEDIGGKVILGRFEICPAHDDTIPTLTAISGGIELDSESVETAIKEAYEEAGYRLSTSDLINLGECRLSTNQDTVVYCYAADVTDKHRYPAPGDGTKGEQGAYCDWVTVEEAVMSKSAYMSVLLLRLWLIKGSRFW